MADTNGSVCTIQRLAGTNKFSVVSLRTSGDCGKFRREERVIWCMGAEEFLSCTYREFFECLQCFDAVGWAAGRAPGL